MTVLRRPWRARHRELLGWLLALLLCVGVAGLAPELDLRLSALAYEAGRGFVHGRDAWVRIVYQSVPWITRVAGVALVLALTVGRRRVPRWLAWRGLALLLSLVLGVGLAVNAGLKSHWGRPRPVQVQAFGGTLPYTPALQPSALCHHNCSFVSGHAASGFAVGALGLFAAPARRRRWLLIGAVAGGAIGLGRVLQGGHFVGDVVFAGLLIWGIDLALRPLCLRWRLWRQRRSCKPSAASGSAAAR